MYGGSMTAARLSSIFGDFAHNLGNAWGSTLLNTRCSVMHLVLLLTKMCDDEEHEEILALGNVELQRELTKAVEASTLPEHVIKQLVLEINQPR
jgi:hypothetical protein